MTGMGDNSINPGHLRSFVERVQDRERDRRAAADDIAEICHEAKGQGFDPQAIKKIVKEAMLTESEKAKRDERETIIAIYRDALQK